MASALVESDYEDDEISAATEAKSCRGSLEESDDDSLAGFEDDLDLEEEDTEFDASKEAGKSNGKVSAKRKRKQPDPTKRKQIRRILRDDELTEVTISAQKEERERLRRLELQRSLAAAAVSSSVPQSVSNVVENSTPLSGTSKPSSPLSVDTREKKQDQQVIVIDSDDEGDTSSSFTSSVNCCHPRAVNGNFIEIISSDSELEIDESDDDSDDSGSHTRHDLDYENSGLHVDDSLNQADSQGRVLVNVNHPADEEDIFLAPQVAKVIKPHQV